MPSRKPPIRVVIECAPTDEEDLWEWWLIERGSGIGGVANGHGYFEPEDAGLMFTDVVNRALDALLRQSVSHFPIELRLV